MTSFEIKQLLFAMQEKTEKLHEQAERSRMQGCERDEYDTRPHILQAHRRDVLALIARLQGVAICFELAADAQKEFRLGKT